MHCNCLHEGLQIPFIKHDTLASEANQALRIPDNISKLNQNLPFKLYWLSLFCLSLYIPM